MKFNKLFHFRDILTSLGLVNILKSNIDLGLRLHIWNRTRQGKRVVLSIEFFDSISDDPEA